MKFPLGTILSVTTGRLLVQTNNPKENGIGEIYEILNFMTGDNLYTHQLPRASDQCKPILEAQLPFLTSKRMNDCLLQLEGALQVVDDQQRRWEFIFKEWLPKVIERFGEYHEVKPLLNYTPVNPIVEAQEMLGTSKEKL